MLNSKTSAASLFEDFKPRFIYPAIKNDEKFVQLISTLDYYSASFICTISSLVFSIITDKQTNNALNSSSKRNNQYHKLLEELIKPLKWDYKKIFAVGNCSMFHGYQNCCFLWDGKQAVKYDEAEPIYCDYLKQKTVGLPHYRFNPYLDIWIRALQTVYFQWMKAKNDCWLKNLDPLLEAFGYDSDMPYLSSTIDLPINASSFDVKQALIHYIRQDAQNPIVKKELRNFKETPKRNIKSATNYINALFDRYARLMVLRIDLGYRQSSDQLTPCDSYERIKQDRERLFNNMRSNHLFAHQVGYISKLEYGLDKGFHYHLLLFFDGSKFRSGSDWYWAKKICDYWEQKITQGHGLAFNCNGKKGQYHYLGIGMIGHRDTQLRSNLINHVVRYLIKPDLFARVIVKGQSSGDHVFERGQTKKKQDPRGRPRKKYGNEA
ncbi:MAG: YagK/YfjJ domain-containing protein [Flavisolibacter sp.]